MNYSRTGTLSRDFLLVVGCCRWSFSAKGADEIMRLARHADWDQVVRIARRHRVEGLVWHSLAGLDVPLPLPIAADLAASARSISEQGLRAAAECERLRQAFEDAGIALLFVKGLTVGQLAYPSPFLKMSWDIDLLIAPQDVAPAAGLLDRLGYRATVPATSDHERLRRWHRRRKESVWFCEERRTGVDLHTRLSDNPRLIPELTVGSPRQLVKIAPNIRLATLARDELFAYLCVHGASSAWFRLKWISDLAGLLDGLEADEIDRLHTESQRLGSGRAAGQALLLAHLLFDLPLGRALEKRLAGDRATRLLVQIALRQLAGRNDLKEPTKVRLGTATIHLSQLLMEPGWRSAWRELRRKVGERLA